jgi:putative methionine-R-sulfoxide reductase with GAF domain
MTSVVPRSLDHTLTDASDVAEASQLVVDHLTAAGIAKPSVYLARGDRLRIQAVEGYQQVFDGMPVGVGVIGRAYVTGEECVVDDVLADDGYLRANPNVRAEACFPLSCCGRLVGALNVESLEPLSAAAIDEVRAAARSLEVAFLRLGHVLRESPAQRLVRHALRLGALTEPADIHAEVVAAAIDVADMASAALLLPGQRGRFRVVDADGLLAGVLDGVSPDAIQAIAALVQSGCSCYTVGGTIETGEELGVLRAEGAQAVIAVPLSTGPAAAACSCSPTSARSCPAPRPSSSSSSWPPTPPARCGPPGRSRSCATARRPTRSPGSDTTGPSTRRSAAPGPAARRSAS